MAYQVEENPSRSILHGSMLLLSLPNLVSYFLRAVQESVTNQPQAWTPGLVRKYQELTKGYVALLDDFERSREMYQELITSHERLRDRFRDGEDYDTVMDEEFRKLGVPRRKGN